MSSNSIRVSADLFEEALSKGSVLSRSAAQQLEHWARLGAAVEASGLSVPQLVALLQAQVRRSGAPELAELHSNVAPAGTTEPHAQLWARKRAQQQRDIARISSGQSDNAAMSWFSGGRAWRAKAVNSPF